MESRSHNESKLISMVTLDQHVSRRRTIERTKLCSICGTPVTRKRHTIPVLCDVHRAIQGARRQIENMTLDEVEASGLVAEVDDAIAEVNEFVFASLAAQMDGQEPPPAPMTLPEVNALMQQRLNQRVEQRVDRKPEPTYQRETVIVDVSADSEPEIEIPPVPRRDGMTDLEWQQARNDRSDKIEASRHRFLAKIPKKTGDLPYPDWTGDRDVDFLLMQRTDALNEYESYLDMEHDAFREQSRLLELVAGINEQLTKKGWPFS